MHARLVKGRGNLLHDSIVNSTFRNKSECNFNVEWNVTFQKEGICETNQ
jgi:hypothetical protein